MKVFRIALALCCSTRTLAFAQAPTIVTQPADCYVLEGGSCTLNVVTTGSSLTYQWYHGVSGDTSNPSTTDGYNTCCHTLYNVQNPSARWVRVSNSFGSVDSDSAAAIVGTPPNASAATAYNGPNYSHIVIVLEENHNYDDIIGDAADAPYINGRLLAGGANFTDMKAISHPSEPNYFALYGGSDFGLTDDLNHTLSDPSLYTVLNDAGKTFTGYAEAGSPRRHNPWESFPEGRSVEADFSTFPTTAGGFAALPSVSWVSPNLDHDMHSGTILQADRWLENHLGAFAEWARSNNSLSIVTFDEDRAGTPNRIPTIIYGAGVNPGNYGTAYTHYSTFRTVLDANGLGKSAFRQTVAAVPYNGGIFDAGPSCTKKSAGQGGGESGTTLAQ